MILADTSVWVEHFRGKNSQLSAYLQHGEVWTHPFVIGELACGNLPQRKQTLHLLTLLPNVTLAEHGEVLTFLNTYSLQGIGLSWIDIHILTSAVISHTRLWTLDRRLASIAGKLSVAHII